MTLLVEPEVRARIGIVCRQPTRKSATIRVLGGDPADVQTKAEASELIDRLRRLRGAPSPLDPYKLETRGTKSR